MFRRFSTSYVLLSILLDAGVLLTSLAVAALIRPLLNNWSFIIYMPAPVRLPALVYLLALVVWVGIFFLLGIYDGRKNYRAIDEFSSLSLGALLAGVSLAGVLYLSYREVSRALYLSFFIFACTGLASWRIAARLIFRRSAQRAPAQRRVLFVGAGPLAKTVAEQVQAYANLGWALAGFLEEQPGQGQDDPRVLGTLSQVGEIVDRQQIDDVLIAMPQGTHLTTNRLLAELHGRPVKIWAVPDYFSLSLQRAQYENFAGLAMLDLQPPELTDSQRLIKRLADLLVCAVLFLPASLLMGVIAIAIRRETHAPAIFKQARVGEGGRLFNMYKFRTMVPEAEQLQHLVQATDEQGNLIHKQADDPRVTRLGRLLRRTSLDELPQIFNILKGEMSLVGPRPELPYLVERYEPWQHRRLAVPQGLTGWWQVNGRSDRPMHLHTEDDLYYIQHYSISLDLKILMMTVVTVLRGRGAF